VSKRKPPNLAQAAQRYAESVWKRMQDASTPLTDVKLELAMAYLAGALRVADGKPKEAP